MSETSVVPFPDRPDTRPSNEKGLAALMKLANAARETMQLDQARRAYEQILSFRPGDLDACIGLMRCHFYAQNWAEAWKAFEVRFRVMGEPPAVFVTDRTGQRREKPRWTGGPAPKSLLVLDEQGMGDTIQFMRFLPRLIAGGTQVTLVTHRRLFALIRAAGITCPLRPMDEPGSVTGIEAWSPLLSLPMAMGSPAVGMDQPYLGVDPARIARWRSWLGPAGLKVGIAWQGNPKAPVDAGRSAGLAALGPLAAIPGVRLVSLQQTAGADQLAATPFGRRILVPPPDFDAGPDAFLDTAALMASLDLVVTVDTAVAHVAGALGRPVAVALQARDADWRWTPGQTRSPWYPSATLYRQAAPGDWWSAFARIAEDIRSGLERRKVSPGMPVTPVSIGELLDKITILAIKADRMEPGAKRDNVGKELTALRQVQASLLLRDGAIATLYEELKRVNERLWIIEDDIRACEARKDFGPEFIDLARAVYVTNDRRAALKSEINSRSGSTLREEKSYASSS